MLFSSFMFATLGACVSDNNLSGKKSQPDEFEEADKWEPPVDTAVDDTAVDTGGDVIVDETCADDDLFVGGYALTSVADCEAPPKTTPDWTLAYKWKDAAVGMMLSTVSVANLTDDNGNGVIDDGDTPDVVAAPYSGSIIAYDGETGSKLWTATSSNIEQSTPAIGDLDGDGFPEVMVAGLSGSKAVHGEDGSAYWQGVGANGIKEYCGSAGIADLDGDGDPEVFTGREIMNGQTGAVLANGAYGNGSSISGEAPNSIAADIDLDGEQEVIVGNAAYHIDGSALYHTSDSDGFPAVANFDSDDEGEVVVAQQGKVTLFDTDGTKIWSTTLSYGGYSGPPAIADFDGDGDPEIAIPVSPGVVMLDGDGTQVWHWAGTSSTFFDGVSAYDLDGDGIWEILHVGNSGVTILEGNDGSVLSTLAAAQSYCGQMPVVADLDNDDHVEIAFGTYNSGVYVMEDSANGFVAGFDYWNQNSFSITNFNSDGSIPEVPDTNWRSGYNNFRAGPPVNAVFPDRNLVGIIQGVCTDDCDTDSITVSFSVGNNGTEDITDTFPVEIWGVGETGETLLYTTDWTAGAEAGFMENSTTVTITGVPLPLYDVFIKVDGGNEMDYDMVDECIEDDNEQTWGAYICLNDE